MTYARKVDANQPEIVKAFRDLGAAVVLLHRVGGGCPDLLVSRTDIPPFLVEIKDGAKPKSARKLRGSQEVFHSEWPHRIEVVTSVDDVLRIMGAQE